YPSDPRIVLANLDGNGKRQVCIVFLAQAGTRRIVILEDRGQERARREVKSNGESALEAVDLNGDGRDELLLSHTDPLEAWSGDLKQLWCSPAQSAAIDHILPATHGLPPSVVIEPAVILDGAAGQPRWAGQPSLKPPAFKPVLLDPGDAKRRPLFISAGLGAT